jgi:maltooligosyltrehalose trehalohydrolase
MLDSEVQAALPTPDDEETFRRCRLDLTERESHAEAYRLHRDLLALRRSDPTLSGAGSRGLEGAVLTAEAFVLRYRGEKGNDRLLIVNLGPDVHLTPVPEPLLAPPAGMRWSLQWSSEAVAYGGLGRAGLRPHPAWHVPGEAAVLLRPEADDLEETGDRDE